MSVSNKPLHLAEICRAFQNVRFAALNSAPRAAAVLASGLFLIHSHTCLAEDRNQMAPIASASLETKDSSLNAKAELLVPGFDRLTATRERPLFTPARHQPLPPPPALVRQTEAPPPPPPVPPPAVSLLGTVLGDGPAQAFAVIKGADGSKTRHVIIGDEIENWKIANIEAQEIVISHDERSVKIKLASDKPAAPAIRPFIAPPPFPLQGGRPDIRTRRFNGLPQQQ